MKGGCKLQVPQLSTAGRVSARVRAKTPSVRVRPHPVRSVQRVRLHHPYPQRHPAPTAQQSQLIHGQYPPEALPLDTTDQVRCVRLHNAVRAAGHGHGPCAGDAVAVSAPVAMAMSVAISVAVSVSVAGGGVRGGIDGRIRGYVFDETDLQLKLSEGGPAGGSVAQTSVAQILSL